MVGPTCVEHQHAPFCGVQPAAAVDDRGEVDEALAVIEGDLELLVAVASALVGEMLTDLLEVARWPVGNDAGVAGEHLSPAALVEGVEAHRERLLRHGMELGWLHLVPLIGKALGDPRRQLQPTRVRRRGPPARGR
jgi:hypothetical protein